MGTAGEHSHAPPTVRIEPSPDPGSEPAPATLPEEVPTPARGDKIARFVVLDTLGVWPQHHLFVLGLTNAAFVAFVMLIWRPRR